MKLSNQWTKKLNISIVTNSLDGLIRLLLDIQSYSKMQVALCVANTSVPSVADIDNLEMEALRQTLKGIKPVT